MGQTKPHWFAPNRKILLLKTLIHLISLIIVFNLYYLAINDRLGSDPVEAVIHSTGIGGLNLLLLTLLVSPLAKILKQGWLMQVRRLLGLYVFFYASLHLLSYAAFELQWDFSLLAEEIIKRPYITLGMIVFIMLSILSVTSLQYYKRKLGKTWQKIHNLVYLIAILVPIHFWWSVKSDFTEPLIYCLLVAILLWIRKEKLRRLF